MLRIFGKKMSMVIQDVPHEVFSLIQMHFSRVNQVTSLELNVLLDRHLYFLELSIRNIRFIMRGIKLRTKRVQCLQFMSISIEKLIDLGDVAICFSWRQGSLRLDLSRNKRRGRILYNRRGRGNLRSRRL
jgi:hypothetical protein